MAARRRGTCLAARTIRAKGDYRSSAAITVLFAQALTRPAPPPRAGVLFPEEVVTLDDIRPGLAGAGITIVDEHTTPSGWLPGQFSEPSRGALVRAGRAPPVALQVPVGPPSGSVARCTLTSAPSAAARKPPLVLLLAGAGIPDPHRAVLAATGGHGGAVGRVIALMALATLGLSGAPVHEPVHG